MKMAQIDKTSSSKCARKIEELLGDAGQLFNKIEQAMRDIKEPEDSDIETNGRAMADLKALDEMVDEVAKKTGELYRYYQQVIMPKRMEEMGEDVQKFVVKGLGTFSLVDDFHVSIIASKKDEAKDWLNENNMGDLITETVNASSLKASIKKWTAEKGTFPDAELFRTYTFQFVKLTKR